MDLIYLSAAALSQQIRSKKVSSLEAVKACQARIAKVNPQLNAVVQLCSERALGEAKEADALLAKGKPKGPLHGVPMTIKDSFDTAGVVSTGGTLGRKDYLPAKDATAVARVRAAGAILLGKTNTPEFTLSFVTTNLIYGPSKNPYNLNRQPSGSSGGAAAIIAAGGSYFDIGSDSGGSIRVPSHACGIAGIKPTAGCVPRTGHIVDYGGFTDSYQQVGPMARRVEDLALILPILAGPDYVDAAIAPVPLGDPSKVDLKSLRVAWYTSVADLEPTSQIQRMVQDCAGMMKEAGARVEEARPPLLREAGEIRRKLGGADGGARLRRMAARAGTKQTSPTLVWGDDQQLPSPQFTDLIEKLDDCRSRMLQFLENFEVVLCPASRAAAPLLEAPADSLLQLYLALQPDGLAGGGGACRNLARGPAVGHPDRRPPLERAPGAGGGGPHRIQDRRLAAAAALG